MKDLTQRVRRSDAEHGEKARFMVRTENSLGGKQRLAAARRDERD